MRKALLHLKSADPVLAAVIDRVGPYRIAYRPPDFSTLARSIVYQQLSGKAAATIFARLEQSVAPHALDAAAILRLDPARLRTLGLSSQKSAYLLDLAQKTASGALNFEALPTLPDGEVIDHLTSVKGVGVWTAQMFLIFALRRPDVLPVADLGIQNAIHRLYRLRKPPKPKKIVEIARPWRPYASVASWYLWRSLDNVAAL